jgi:hypothetical protein
MINSTAHFTASPLFIFYKYLYDRSLFKSAPRHDHRASGIQFSAPRVCGDLIGCHLTDGHIFRQEDLDFTPISLSLGNT